MIEGASPIVCPTLVLRLSACGLGTRLYQHVTLAGAFEHTDQGAHNNEDDYGRIRAFQATPGARRSDEVRSRGAWSAQFWLPCWKEEVSAESCHHQGENAERAGHYDDINPGYVTVQVLGSELEQGYFIKHLECWRTSSNRRLVQWNKIWEFHCMTEIIHIEHFGS